MTTPTDLARELTTAWLELHYERSDEQSEGLPERPDPAVRRTVDAYAMALVEASDQPAVINALIGLSIQMAFALAQLGGPRDARVVLAQQWDNYEGESEQGEGDQ